MINRSIFGVAACWMSCLLFLLVSATCHPHYVAPRPSVPMEGLGSVQPFVPSLGELAVGELRFQSPIDMGFRRMSLFSPLNIVYQAGPGALVRSSWGRGWTTPEYTLTLRQAADGITRLTGPFGTFLLHQNAPDETGERYTSPESPLVFYRNGSSILLHQDAKWTFAGPVDCNLAEGCLFALSKLSRGPETLELSRDAITGKIKGWPTERIRWESALSNGRSLVKAVVHEVYDDSVGRGEQGERDPWSELQRFVLVHDEHELLREVRLQDDNSTVVRTWIYTYQPETGVQVRDAHVPLQRLTKRILEALGAQSWNQVFFSQLYRIEDLDGDGRLDAEHGYVDGWYLSSAQEHAVKNPVSINASECAYGLPHTRMVLPSIHDNTQIRLYVQQPTPQQVRLTICPGRAGPPLLTQTLELPAVMLLGTAQVASSGGDPYLQAEATVADILGDGVADLVLMTTDGFVAAPLVGGEAPFGRFERSSSMGSLSERLSHQLIDLNGDGHLDLAEHEPTQGTVRVWYGTGIPLFFHGPAPVSVSPAGGHCSDSFASWSPLSLVPDLVRICQSPSFDALFQVLAYEEGQGWIREKARREGRAVLLSGGLLDEGPPAALTWIDFYGPPTTEAGYLGAVEITGLDERAGQLTLIDDGLGTLTEILYESPKRQPGLIPSQPRPGRVLVKSGSAIADTLLCHSDPQESYQGARSIYQWSMVYTGIPSMPIGSCEEPNFQNMKERLSVHFDTDGKVAFPVQVTRSQGQRTKIDDYVWDPSTERPWRLQSHTESVGLGEQERITRLTRFVYLPENTTLLPDSIEQERDGDRLLITFGQYRRDVTVQGLHRDPSKDFVFKLGKDSHPYKKTEAHWLEEGGQRFELESIRWDQKGRLVEKQSLGRPPLTFEYQGRQRLPSSVVDEYGETQLSWDPIWDFLAEASWGDGTHTVRVQQQREGPMSFRTRLEAGDSWVERSERTSVLPDEALWETVTSTTSDAGSLSAQRQVSSVDGAFSAMLDNACGGVNRPACISWAKKVDDAGGVSLGLRTEYEPIEVTLTSATLRELTQSASLVFQQGEDEVGVGWSTWLAGVHHEKRWLLGDGDFEAWLLRSNRLLARGHASPGGLRSSWSSVEGARVEYDRDVLGRISKIELGQGEVRTYRHNVLGLAAVHVDRPPIDGPAIDVTIERDTETGKAKTYVVAAGNIQRTDTLSYDEVGRLQKLSSVSDMGQDVTYEYAYVDTGPGKGLLGKVSGPSYTQELGYDKLGRLARRLTRLSGSKEGSLEESYTYHGDGRLQRQQVMARTPAGVQSAAVEYRLNARGQVEQILLDGKPEATLSWERLSLSVQAGPEKLTLAWLQDGRLSSATKTGAGQSEVAYRMSPQILTPLIGTETYLWQGGQQSRSYDYSIGDHLLTAMTSEEGSLGFDMTPYGRLRARSGAVESRVEQAPGTWTVGAHQWVVNDLGLPTKIDGAALVLDARGRIVEDGKKQRYVYDDQDHLLAVHSAETPSMAGAEAWLSPAGLSLAVEVEGWRIGTVREGKLVLEVFDGRGSLVRQGAPDPLGAGSERLAGEELLSGRALPELGLVQLGSRQYDPLLGRFSSPDFWLLLHPEQCITDPQGCDLIAYAGGDPVNHVDPSGTRRILVQGSRCVVKETVKCVYFTDSMEIPDAPSGLAGPVGPSGETGMAWDAFPECEKETCGETLEVYAPTFDPYSEPGLQPPDVDPIDVIAILLTGGSNVVVRGATKGVVEEVATVQANRTAGNAFRDEIAQTLQNAGREVRTEVYKSTPFGRRFIDIEVWLEGRVLGGVETKLGGSPYTPAQRAKDAWLWLMEDYPVNLVRGP